MPVLLPAAPLSTALLLFIPLLGALLLVLLLLLLLALCCRRLLPLFVGCRCVLLPCGIRRGRILNLPVLRLLALLASRNPLLARRRMLVALLLTSYLLRPFQLAALGCRRLLRRLLEMLAYHLVMRLVTVLLSA